MCTQHLLEKFPNLFFHLDLTKEDRTLDLHEAPLKPDQDFLLSQVIQAKERVHHEDRKFHSRRLRLKEEDQIAL